jgi:hypothetical protein
MEMIGKEFRTLGKNNFLVLGPDCREVLPHNSSGKPDDLDECKGEDCHPCVSLGKRRNREKDPVEANGRWKNRNDRGRLEQGH